jgi:hypothetical protein
LEQEGQLQSSEVFRAVQERVALLLLKAVALHPELVVLSLFEVVLPHPELVVLSLFPVGMGSEVLRPVET